MHIHDQNCHTHMSITPHLKWLITNQISACDKYIVMFSHSRTQESCLHSHRPRRIVQHCLEKIDLAKSIPAHHVISKGEGQFDVHSQTARLDVWCKVSFGGHNTTPSCTCKEWPSTHIPCKHMFVIFRHEPDWGFQKLCENYRNSPFFTLDEDLIFPVNNVEPVAEFPIEERMTADSEESVDTQANVDKDNLPLPNRFNKTVAAQCRDLMNQAPNLHIG